MGRSKPVPKRRRVEADTNSDLTPAASAHQKPKIEETESISILRSAPLAEVEAAAAEALRSNLSSWDRLDSVVSSDATAPSSLEPKHPLPDAFSGLGHTNIPPANFAVLRALHDTIKNRASSWASWSGSPSDPKRRAFGFLPRTLGYDPKVREKLDISSPGAGAAEAAMERKDHARAVVVLKDSEVPENLEHAMRSLLDELRPAAPESLRRYLSYSELVAAQPNLHSGQALLPAHVDHPSRDGFGIVIVTIAIRGSGTIMLASADGALRGALEVKAEEAYMLSGMARDGCTHGVLADIGSESRESLNLRLGLHDSSEGGVSKDEVLKHWGDSLC